MTLEHFLRKLRGMEFEKTPIGIRNSWGECPICAICRVEGYGEYDNGLFYLAAQRLGLTMRARTAIAVAADGDLAQFSNEDFAMRKEVCRRMQEITGINLIEIPK